MISSKNILLITTEKAFYNSLKKVLSVVSSINVNMASTDTELNDFINRKNIDVIMYQETSRNELYKWLWTEIRISNNSPLPFIALGKNRIDSINRDSRDIIFEKKSESHEYIGPPHRLVDLFSAFSEIGPAKEKMSDLIVKFGNWKGIAGEILRHEIPNKLCTGNRNRNIAVRLYEIAKNLSVQYEKNDNLIAGIDKEIDNVKNSDINNSFTELSKNSRKLSEFLT